MRIIRNTIGLLLLFSSPIFAVSKIAVTVSDGSLQSGTTTGFNVSSGTVKNLNTSTATITKAIAIGRAVPSSANVIDIDTDYGGIRLESREFGGGAGSGRLGPIGLAVAWSTTTQAAGDYIAIVNGQFVEPSGNTDEYAELGTVLIDNTDGSEDSAVNLLVRGGGKTFLSGGSQFNFYSSSGTGATFRVGYPITPTQTQPFVDGAGGLYVYSTNSFPNGITGGAQPQVPINNNYTARSTNPVIVMLGDHLSNVDGFKIYTDTVTANSGYTPTLRFFINNSSAQINVPTTIKGTVAADNAPDGYIGQRVSSNTINGVNGVNGQYVNFVSTVITPGDWSCSALINIDTNTATAITQLGAAISVNSGNTTTDHVNGLNTTFQVPAPGASLSGMYPYVIPEYTIQTASTQTVYLKFYSEFTTGAVKARWGSLRCRRER